MNAYCFIPVNRDLRRQKMIGQKMRKRKGFTLAELVTAIAILVMIVGFTTAIFKSSIGAYRTASANIEIMQKLRAITGQLNTDFEGLCKDGYLIIKTSEKARKEYDSDSESKTVCMDRIYFFTIGDFQSWDRYEYEHDKFKYAKSNIARVFWGHSSESLTGVDAADRIVFLSECRLARNALLLTPKTDSTEAVPIDCSNISFAQCKADLSNLEEPDDVLNNSVSLVDPNNFGSFVCEGVGEFRIEWTNGDFDTTGCIKWEPGGRTWEPNNTKPKAIKFTFTLYDSKGILKEGRRFSHIVYIDN